MENGLVTVLFF